MTKWLSPMGVFRVIERYDIVRSISAEDANAFDEESGEVDWSLLRDASMDDYYTMMGYPFVKAGWFDVDKPMREHRAMFVGIFPTEIAERARQAAKCGLYTNAATGEPCIGETINQYRDELRVPLMSETRREELIGFIKLWKEMFAEDERVVDFEVEFTLNMIERRRIHVKDPKGRRGKQNVVYELASRSAR